MNKPRDDNGRFLPTNPHPWVRPLNLPQYHPAHASTQVNVLLRTLIAARDKEVVVAEPVAADASEINDLLKVIISGSNVNTRRDELRAALNQTARPQPTSQGSEQTLSNLLRQIVAGAQTQEEKQ
jgi:hypothetical protein